MVFEIRLQEGFPVLWLAQLVGGRNGGGAGEGGATEEGGAEGGSGGIRRGARVRNPIKKK